MISAVDSVNLLLLDKSALRKKSTRELVSILKKLRPIVYKPFKTHETIYEDTIFFIVKEELSNRPHVPNKQEAKAIRQSKAKNKQH